VRVPAAKPEVVGHRDGLIWPKRGIILNDEDLGPETQFEPLFGDVIVDSINVERENIRVRECTHLEQRRQVVFINE
jgi:hypothetical protein